MEPIVDPEEKITCPYNPAHQIRRCRMGVHLVKCKKNYPKARMAECEFNKTHTVPEPELQYHHENCPDRKKIEILVYSVGEPVEDKYPIQKIDVPTDECWDDLDVPTYNPVEYCEKNEILRHVDVKSASVRKNFRVEERHRINSILNEKTGASKPSTNQNGSRRPLPDTAPNVRPNESTPEVVSDLMARIKIGANRPVIPAKK